jgi:hypothetical protein
MDGMVGANGTVDGQHNARQQQPVISSLHVLLLNVCSTPIMPREETADVSKTGTCLQKPPPLQHPKLG